MRGEECAHTTAPVSVPVVPGTPLHPVRGYHVGRFGHAHRRGLLTAAELEAVTAGLLPGAIVWHSGDAARQPDMPAKACESGPFETEREARNTTAVQTIYDAFYVSPGVGRMAPHSHNILSKAWTAAGLEVGTYDDRILVWLSQWEPTTCMVIAGLITRASEAAALPPQVRDLISNALRDAWSYRHNQIGQCMDCARAYPAHCAHHQADLDRADAYLDTAKQLHMRWAPAEPAGTGDDDGDELVIDPDCRDGKHRSCIGGPCACPCHFGGAS
jgi:hypothetical protein